MQRYRITASDGTVHEIDGPDNATREQVLAAIEADIASERIAKAEEEYEAYLADRIEIQPEPEDESLFLTNIGRGIDQLQQAYGSALEGVGDVTGLEGLEQYGADVLEENRRQLEETAAAARSTKDIEGLGSFVTEYVPATFGAQIPQLGSTLAGSATGAAIGSVVPIIGPAVGAIAGGIAANLPYFFGANREAQKEEIAAGNRQEISEGAAALTAIPQSVLDFIADRFLISGFTGKALTGGGIFTRAATGVGAGVVTEVPTEIGQQVLERLQAGQELVSDEALDEYFEVAVAAGLVGGTVRPSATTPTEPAKPVEPVEPTQGELFSPDADLGARPLIEESRREAQGELFPEEDLGRAPIEDTQFDLFGPAGSPEAELRRQIRASQLEKERAMRSSEPIAPFEEGRDYPFFERASVDTAEAGRRLAELEGRREPTQEELQFESVPGAEAEQAAQAAARERAALRAIERSDEAAFEQPDLFALQQEQEDRRLGVPPLARGSVYG
jgi:hypothetical protein